MRKRDREFLREVLHEQRLLSERHMRQLAKEGREARERADAEMREHFAKQDKKLDQIIADGEAERKALIAILDKLSNGGAAAAG